MRDVWRRSPRLIWIPTRIYMSRYAIDSIRRLNRLAEEPNLSCNPNRLHLMSPVQCVGGRRLGQMPQFKGYVLSKLRGLRVSLTES